MMRLLPAIALGAALVAAIGLAGGEPPSDIPQAVASVRSKLKVPIIVIDPGHGGYDEGAIGGSGTREKDVTLDTARRVQRELLRRIKARVTLTRKEDVDVAMEERVRIAHERSADVLISIHYDAFTDPDVRGITTYFFDDEDLRLAEEIHERLLDAGLDTEDRGIEFEDYIVLRDNPIPAVLLELGYITNPDDEANMKSSEYQEKVAAAIADGIVDYLRSR